MAFTMGLSEGSLLLAANGRWSCAALLSLAYITCLRSQSLSEINEPRPADYRGTAEFYHFSPEAGDNAVCDERFETSRAGPGWGNITNCQHRCAISDDCDAFTFFTDFSCRTYSSCPVVMLHNPWVRTTILKKRWPDEIHTSVKRWPMESCWEEECLVQVGCREGYGPVQCESVSLGQSVEDYRNGAWLDVESGMCNARGAQAGAQFAARVTCRRNIRTWTVETSLQLDARDLVHVSCPSGSAAMSCNCFGLGNGACDGKFTFSPVGRTCAMDHDRTYDMGISAICSSLETCQRHVCPNGYALKSNAHEIFCSGTACSSADDASCCTLASCSLQSQLSNLSSKTAMAAAGWDFDRDGDFTDVPGFPGAFCYGLKASGNTSLALHLTGQGVLKLDFGSCQDVEAAKRTRIEIRLRSQFSDDLKFNWTMRWFNTTTVRYFGGETLEIRAIGGGVLIQRLQFICSKPATLTCSRMGGTDCSGELRTWAGADTCVANVPTGGATCREYCGQRHLSCVKGMDNDGTQCGLYREGHGRQTQEQNGCLQRWADQICVCAHNPVRVELNLRGGTQGSSWAGMFQKQSGELYALGNLHNRDFCTTDPGVMRGRWWQVYLGETYYIDGLRIKWAEEQFSYFVVKVNGVVCAAVAHEQLLGPDVACRSIGRSLQIESRSDMELCTVTVWVLNHDAVWLHLSDMVASGPNTTASEDALLPLDGHVDGGSGSDSLPSSCWSEFDMLRSYQVKAVQFVNHDRRAISGFDILVDMNKCAGPVFAADGESKSVQCYARGQHLKIIENRNQEHIILCNVSIAVPATDVPLITEPQESSLEDLRQFCFVADKVSGLLATLATAEASFDQNGLVLASDLSLSFCIDACRKREACVRIVLDSTRCLLFSKGLGPSGVDRRHTAERSVCWAKHSRCHESASQSCDPEMAATVITSNVIIKVPLSKGAAVMAADLSVWQSSIAMAYPPAAAAWVNVVDIGVLNRRLRRRLGALLHQEIFIVYEIVVPPGSEVPIFPTASTFLSACKSQPELAGRDLQVVELTQDSITDRPPYVHSEYQDPSVAAVNEDKDSGGSSLIVIILAAVFGSCCLALVGYRCQHGRKPSSTTSTTSLLSGAKVGRPCIQDEAEIEELTAVILEVLPSYWASIGNNRAQSFGRLVSVSSDKHHVFSELLNHTYRPIVTQDRLCPNSKCKKTPGGCPCVRPGGSPGLPVEFMVRRVIRVEDSSMWNRYVQKQSSLRRTRTGTDDVKPVDPPVFTNDAATRYPDILESSASDLNEVYLWHGTHVRKALSIAQNDFNMDLAGSGAGTMYGPGTYLAESSTKADEYAQHEQGGYYDNVFAMVLCRTSLGKYYYTTERQPDAVTKVQSGEFDSVCGDRAKSVNTFREMVVYDPDQVYPEYIVLYSRLHHQDDALKMRRLASMPFQMQLPLYWKDCHKDPQQEPFRIQYRVRRHTHKDIQQLVANACVDAGIAGKVLLAARRIEDSEMWVNYSEFKHNVKARLREGECLAPPNELDGNSKTGHVITATLMQRLGAESSINLENLDESVNELLLWHGTDAKSADIISRSGFRIPVGETAKHGKRFGEGAYLAEDLNKSLSYAPSGSKGVQYVLLCRAVCGDIHYTEDGWRHTAHQEARANQKDCVLANPNKTGPREFILLDEKQVYPEFVLELTETPAPA